jgi:hypothetical protein
MQRYVWLVVGVAVVVLAAVLVMKGGKHGTGGSTKSGDGGTAAAVGAGDGGAALDIADADLLLDFPTFPPTMPPQDGGVGWVMPDGTPVPALPATAPKQVKVGGILVLYAGAELAPKGSRSKDDAKALAAKLDAEAKDDFHAAVRDGDPAFSFDDMGVIYRGSLEPAVEYIVFNLDVGQVSDVIETPRGYWIVKRLE